jgi:selenide,water dikinase
LACDVPLLATPSHPPSWLAQSALALAEDGYLATNDYLQSITHANVFCTGAYSSGGGTALWDILRAAIAYGPLQAHVPQPSALKFVSCGKRYAIGCWGQYCVQGHWVWWLKYGLDKRHLAKLQSVTA